MVVESSYIDASMGIGASGARKRRLKRRRISAPGNFMAVATASDAVLLSWTASTGLYVDGYRIFRNGVEIADVPVQFAGTYGDDPLTPDTPYSYEIYAYNRFQGQSPSAVATVTTPEETP